MHTARSRQYGDQRLPRPHRVPRLSREAQWWVIGGLGAAALAIGFVGLRDYALATGGPAGFFDVAYRDIQLWVLESGALSDGGAIPISLQLARFLAPAVGAIALIRVFASLFRDHAQLLRLRFTRDHVVVCGLGAEGLTLARSLRAQRYHVVAVERDAENDGIVSCRSAGVPVIVGDATDPATLHSAGVERASRVVVMCGDSGVNAEVAASVGHLAASRRQPLDCLVHMDEPRLSDLLRTRYLTARPSPTLRLDFFNIHERAAQVLLLRHPFFGDDAAFGGERPHVLLVGLGSFGRSVLVEAARAWIAAGPGLSATFRVTVVDPTADTELQSFEHAHPEVARVCELVPRRVELADDLDAGSFFPAQEATTPPSIAYVCIDDDVVALRTALVLHEWLRDRRIPIVVRSQSETGVPALMRQHPDGGGFENLHGFALLDRTCNADFLFAGTYELLAQALHESYVRHREAQGWSHGPELDEHRRLDPALAPWPQLAEPLRESNRAQAAHTGVKLAAVGCRLEARRRWESPVLDFTADEVEQLALLEHARWVDERVASGWKRGDRDPSRHRTPYLVSYDELTDDIKELDRMFVRSLPRLLARLGFQVVREGSTAAPTPSGAQPHAKAR